MEDECENTSQTFVGNAKKIDLSINSGVLRVIGNNSFVTVTKNVGQIMIIGNKGHVQVTENTGFIGYTGNNGLVEVGTTSKGIGRVVYTGNGGKVKRMKTNGVIGKRDAEKSSTKNPLPPKQEGQPAKKTDVQSELRVNKVEMCINSKSKQGIHKGVTKENISPDKLKRTPMPQVGTCYEVKNVWRQASSKSDEQKKAKIKTIKTSRRKIIQVSNLSNFELENWCLNLAAELIALHD
ncbi:uncharacterized protein LOC110827118 [Zootermopsis nevadensis]|uniref:Uncharacterized protein n=1 Tax=Zootermopsis nevadensis TaxID=136037 RepID=A0A067RED0_ZOONE|nr:uncharacterized protein LOC110827118 [Zootermopsis nevadensis]KDR22206.1 hypothetical protein L798_01812 [Zootermopsis nevadensis]